MRKTRASLLLCLTLSSFFGGGCAGCPVATQFDGQWKFIDQLGEPRRACLTEPEVDQLKQILDRCKAAQ